MSWPRRRIRAAAWLTLLAPLSLLSLSLPSQVRSMLQGVFVDPLGSEVADEAEDVVGLSEAVRRESAAQREYARWTQQLSKGRQEVSEGRLGGRGQQAAGDK